MRDFGWGNRIAHLLGEIIQALIILISVAVLAGLIFLLVRYLLVATRAAQLYVAQHEPPPPLPQRANQDAPVPAPDSTAAEQATHTATADGTAPTTPLPPSAPTEPSAGSTRPTKPKSPPRA